MTESPTGQSAMPFDWNQRRVSVPIGEPIDTAQPSNEVKREFLRAARARGAGFVATAEANATTDRPVPANQKLKLNVDAVLDGLIFKLETR